MESFLRSLIVFISLFISTSYVSAQCKDTNVWNDSWTSCELSNSPNTVRGNSHWLLYEFAEAQAIDSLHIWNANRTGESSLGAKDISIDYSTDGNIWKELNDYVIPQADESEDYKGFDEVALGGVLVKKILITCSSTYNSNNNDCVSLAEVQFQVVETEEIVDEEEENEMTEAEAEDNQTEHEETEESVVEEEENEMMEEDSEAIAVDTEDELLDEEIKEEIMRVYPNPFTNEVTINGAINTYMEIYDINGRLLMRKIIRLDSQSFDLSNFSSGLYYIISALADDISVFKIVKK